MNNLINKVKFFLSVFLTLNFFLTSGLSKHTSSSTRFCGAIPIQSPFLSPNSTASSPLNDMTLCRSQKLYFRTTLGLFPISSIDYSTKTLTISHPSCSSSHHYVSPSLLSAGFPTPPKPNSLLLINCSSEKYPAQSSMHNCTHLNGCAASFKTNQNREIEVPYSSCLLFEDAENLEKGFHPKDLNCSHYRRVYKRSLSDEDGYELGTRISFDIPGHVPDICDGCKKPDGNCGAGLRCICHIQKCKDKVISMAGSMKPFSSTVLVPLLSSLVLLVFLMNF